MLNSIPESFSLHKSKFWNGEKSSKLHEELLVWNSWQKKNMKTEYWIKVLRLKRKKTVMITNCNANYLYVHCLLQLYLLQKSSLAIIPSFKSYFIIPNKLNMFLIIFKIFWESLYVLNTVRLSSAKQLNENKRRRFFKKRCGVLPDNLILLTELIILKSF